MQPRTRDPPVRSITDHRRIRRRSFPHTSLTWLSLSVLTNARTAPGTAYSSIPVRALITAAVKTDDEKSIDVQHAKKYLAVSTSPKLRQKALNDMAMAGVYVVGRPGHIRPIYILTAANLTACDGTVAKQFVAQGVNDSTKLQPEAVPLDVTGTVAILVKDPPNPPPELWKAHVGSSFVKADVANIKTLHDLIADDGVKYAVAVLPKSMPILWSCPECHRGALDDVGTDLLEQNLPGSSHWAAWMAQWTQATHDALISILATPEDLGTKAPKFKRSIASFWATKASTVTTTLYIDDAEHNAAIAALQKRLAEAVPSVQAPPASVDVPSAPLTSSNGSATPTVATGDTPIPRRATYSHFSDEQVSVMKFQLAHCGYDEDTGTIVIPEINDEMKLLFSLSSIRKRNEHFDNVITGYSETSDESNDFLLRVIDPPALDNAARAFYINALMPTTPMVDMDGPKDRFRVYMIGPDSPASRSAREAARDKCTIEELCGEEGTNLSKVSTSITINHAILSPQPFLSTLSNRCGLIEATVMVDSVDWDAKTNPVLFRFLRALALVLTEHKTRTFFKNCPHVERTKIYGWLLQMVDSFECQVNHVSQISKNVLFALSGEVAKIKVDYLKRAEHHKNEVLDKLMRIVQNTDTVPNCSLNTSMTEKAAAAKDKRKTPEADAHPKVTPDKRLKKADLDLSGCLIYPAGTNMPTVTEANPSHRLCTPHIRKGLACTREGRCPCIHEKDPMKWSIPTLKAWMDLVDANKQLNWDPSVNMEQLKNRIASAAPAAATDK